MTPFERRVRAAVIGALRDTGAAPGVDSLAAQLDAAPATVRDALHALDAAHRLVLRPGTDRVWMAHPFSAEPTGFVAEVGERRWWANCAWDALAIVGLMGDGRATMREPGSTHTLTFEVQGGRVHGEGIVHFLVPPPDFWVDVGYT